METPRSQGFCTRPCGNDRGRNPLAHKDSPSQQRPWHRQIPAGWLLCTDEVSTTFSLPGQSILLLKKVCTMIIMENLRSQVLDPVLLRGKCHSHGSVRSHKALCTVSLGVHLPNAIDGGIRDEDRRKRGPGYGSFSRQARCVSRRHCFGF